MPRPLTEEDKNKFITSVQKQIDGIKVSINLNGKNEVKNKLISSLSRIVTEVKQLSIEDYSNEEAAWSNAYRNLNMQHTEQILEKTC